MMASVPTLAQSNAAAPEQADGDFGGLVDSWVLVLQGVD